MNNNKETANGSPPSIDRAGLMFQTRNILLGSRSRIDDSAHVAFLLVNTLGVMNGRGNTNRSCHQMPDMVFCVRPNLQRAAHCNRLNVPGHSFVGDVWSDRSKIHHKNTNKVG